MNDRQIKLVIGSLLHDIGKVVYRSGDGRNHSESGYDYLKSEANIVDKELLDCVRYHHLTNLKNAKLESDNIAYLTYFADNIAAAIDRREALDADDGFDKNAPLMSVFNILNGNHERKCYNKKILNKNNGINYPTEKAEDMDKQFYQDVVWNITDNLKGITITDEYINSLISVLEANLSYIPSSTSLREQTDISLFDHVRVTAAVAHCMEQYYQEKKISDYREATIANAKQTYDEKMFLLYSMDISGIQKFIYSIGSEGALKGLRSRSFYLEIMMEHIIDELLFENMLSRANLIYSGGGHCYILLPNTERMKNNLKIYEDKVNEWFLKCFGIDLYVAAGYAECSANDLKNEPQGSYSALYLEISKQISNKKSHRYDADQILSLNNNRYTHGERECKICRRMRRLDDESRCSICSSLEKMSGSILKDKFFAVMSKDEEGTLPLPGEKFLFAGNEKKIKNWMESDYYIRSYSKNDFYTGKHMTTKLWVGDYSSGDTFEEFAKSAEGINRIAVLRADVDNLGQTFVQGFQRKNEDDRFSTLSRTATLSRQLSLFFKCYINSLLENKKYSFIDKTGQRNVAIVYSGGDDVFIVGAWNEVVELFIDLKNSLEKFTQNTVTISGGIGLYPAKYPINIMAQDVANLEEISKENEGKNSITLFDGNNSYNWNVFIRNVLEEKFETIKTFFAISENRGKAFLYHILELLRENELSSEKFNRARYVYLLSRMEPEYHASREQKNAYREFSKKMYEWGTNEKDRGEVITAIYLYVYLTREEEEE